MDKLWFVHVMEFQTELKMNILQLYETWIRLKHIMSEKMAHSNAYAELFHLNKVPK